jgi:hypothetical protein
MKSFAKGTIIAVASAFALSTVALADTTTPVANAAPEASPTVTTGSINTDPPFEKRMQECMAVWDKGTHMNKEQWRRSCKTTLQSLSSE